MQIILTAIFCALMAGALLLVTLIILSANDDNDEQ